MSNIIGYPIIAFGIMIIIWGLVLYNTNLSLKDALAIYANSPSNKCNTSYSDATFKHIFESKPDLVPQELFELLKFAEQGKLTLYGHKSFSTNKIPLQPIPVEYLTNDKANWSEDYSTLYFNSNDVAYTDLSVKRKDFISVIKK